MPTATPTRRIPTKWQKLLRLIPRYDSISTAEDAFFVPSIAQDALDFFPECLKHIEGDLYGKPFVLEPHQQAIIANVFGWYLIDDKGRQVRRYREVFLYEPKKNGKTPICAGIANLVLFCRQVDGEMGQQNYIAAADKLQAGKLFRYMQAMVKAEPELFSRCRIYGGNASAGQTKSIVIEDENSFVQIVSADADTKEGNTSHLVIIDELHVQPDRRLVDSLTTSLASENRKQPLVVYLTTADFDRVSICNEVYGRACKVRDGETKNSRFLPVIYEAPKTVTRAQYAALFPSLPLPELKNPASESIDLDYTDPVVYREPKIWAIANPNLGVSVSRAYLETDSQKAFETPGYLPTFLRLHLNVRCLAPWVLVSLADGTRKRADEVLVGDMVIAFDPAHNCLVPSAVSATFENGIYPLYRICTKRGRIIETTGNHPFWVRSGRPDAPKFGWKQADSLKAGDRVGVALGWPDPQGNKILSWEDAYFLGVMVGDGSCRANDGAKLTNSDPEVVDFCRDYAAYHGCRLVPYADDIHYRFSGPYRVHINNGIKTFLRHVGLYGQIDRTKRVPALVYQAGQDALAAFLSGYLDTDGHVGTRSVIFVSMNRALLDDCQHALALLGVQSSIRYVPARKPFMGTRGQLIRTGEIWRLEVHEANGLDILFHRLRPRIARKIDALARLAGLPRRTGSASQDRFTFDPIVSIEQVDASPTIGIEVQQSHTHITSGLITHNTQASSAWLDLQRWDASAGEPVPPIRMVRDDDLPPERPYRLVSPPGSIPERYRGRSCWAGLDLGSTSDLTSLCLEFPEDDGSWQALWWSWVPEVTARKRAQKGDTVYLDCIERGYLLTTPGDETDYEAIFLQICSIGQVYPIAEIAADRNFQGAQLCQDLLKAGFDVVPFGFGYTSMGAPTQEFERLINRGAFHHGGNPVTRWAAGNVIVTWDPTNAMKPDKAKSADKIDPVVSAIIALGRGMAREKLQGSVYETRGLVTL